MLKHKLLLSLAVLTLLAAPSIAQTGAQMSKSKEVKFKVRIENISSAEGQTASNDTKWPFALSPGLWVVHEREVRLFREGNPAVNGLEPQAEHGDPSELVKMLEAREHSGMQHGVFNTPVGASGPGPIGPGGAYEFSFNAKPGMRLSMITMFGQSNDWFYAPNHNHARNDGSTVHFLRGNNENDHEKFYLRVCADRDGIAHHSSDSRKKDADA